MVNKFGATYLRRDNTLLIMINGFIYNIIVAITGLKPKGRIFKSHNVGYSTFHIL